KIKLTPVDTKKTDAPSVVGDILKELGSYGFNSDDLFTGLIHVKSTIDLRIQEIANSALENGILEYEKRHPEFKNEVQGSFVVLDRGGKVLAIGGGRRFYKNREYKYSDLNRVNRKRQVGSTFKPFVYLTAYINGWGAKDIIFDSPFSISMGYGRGRHAIRNYDGKYKGSIQLQDALKASRNVPTVKLTILLGDGEKSGMEKVAETIKLLGIKSELHSDIDHRGKRIYYPTSALGASEMNLMEVANAYREITSGVAAKPYMINEIIDRNGTVKFTRNQNLAPSQIPYVYLDMMQSSLRRVVSEPGGTAYSLTASKFVIPIAGKTGTTDDFRNAWFIGFSRGQNAIVVGVVINFDDNRSLGKAETGSKTALPIVREIFEKIYKKELVGPPEPFLSN
ncbi:MAG: penicillin-binding transpeptidase domain-containing protein, partial [Patescibacteria group bacterium]